MAKHTYRDIKPGKKFLLMAGYGSPVVMSEWKVTEKVTVKRADGKVRDADSGFWAKRIWSTPGYGGAPPEKEWFAKKDTPHFIKNGLILFGREYDRETGLLKWEAPTVEEQEAADKRAAEYERFTKSETYRSM